MPYEIVENFSAGLDTRKSPLTAPAGTLTILKNAHISPGGEITKRRAFVHVATVDPNSFGLAATAERLHVFGRNVMPTAPFFTADGNALGGNNLLWRLIVPDASATMYQTDYDIYDGRVYLAVANGTAVANSHFYDDNAVIADGNTLIATEGGGKGYAVRAYQSKIYAANGHVSNSKYLFFSAISTPQIWNAKPGLADVLVTSLSRGKPARCTVAAGAAGIDKFKNGQFVMVSGADTTKGFGPANGFHRISGVGSPANTFVLDEVDTTAATVASQTTGVEIDAAPDTGRGYINLSVQDSGGEILRALEVYYDKLAVFMGQSIQVWDVDPDPLKNQYVQLLRGAGTLARRSPLQYGSGDVLFLDSSGIRSLKAKDSSNSAAVSDIGSPVDPTVRAMLLSKGQNYMNGAVSLLEPSIGRFWMCFRDEVLCLSYFPGPGITAWSVLTLPFQMQHAVTCNGKIYFRDTNNRIWVYGGADGKTYSGETYDVEVRLPYLTGKKPGHNKTYQAIDMTITGTWTVKVSYDYTNPEAEEDVGTFSASTWNGGMSELNGYSSHMSLRFYNNDANDAVLSNVGVHYNIADDEQ